MTYTTAGIRWVVTARAKRVLQPLQGEFPSHADYLADRNALREFLCLYFNDIGCLREIGNSISPVGGAGNGGKVLKIRWRRPGQGKSGSLRLIAIAYCAEAELRIVFAAKRKDGVTAGEIDDAVAEADAIPPLRRK